MTDFDTDIDSSPSDEDIETVDIEDTSDDDASEDKKDSHGSKRTAEARIQELVSELKQTKTKLSEIEGKMAPPAPGEKPVLTPEMEKAVATLKKLGFTQKDDLASEIKVIEDRLALNQEHAKFERELDGSDGRPKYDRQAVEEFMRQRGIYDPEVAYKAMHETELLDWQIRQADAKKGKKPFVEKPGGSSASTRESDNTITREKIADAMKTPQGRAWYERNRSKILDMMQRGQLQ